VTPVRSPGRRLRKPQLEPDSARHDPAASEPALDDHLFELLARVRALQQQGAERPQSRIDMCLRGIEAIVGGSRPRASAPGEHEDRVRRQRQRR